MFVKTIHKSGIQTALLLAGIVAAAAALLHWPQAVSGGVSRGLSICSTVIIPSLFPFLVWPDFWCGSGVGAALAAGWNGRCGSCSACRAAAHRRS